MIIRVVDNRTAKQVRVVSLKLRTLVACFVFIVSTLSLSFWYYHTNATYSLNQEIKQFKISAKQEAKPEIFTTIKESKPPQKEKLALFLSEITRVRSYEKAIKERFEAMRNVVRSVVGTDLSDEENKRKTSIGHSKERGVGGREIDSDLVSNIDYGIDFLNSAPIGTPLEGEITSGFGNRISPFTRNIKFHTGIDIGISKYSPVLATADGTVTFAGYKSGYGTVVEIRHKLGYKTLFAHLSLAVVQPGQKVCREQRIGLVGMTGSTTGPHLHYEIKRNGISKNPKPYLALTKLLGVAVE